MATLDDMLRRAVTAPQGALPADVQQWMWDRAVKTGDRDQQRRLIERLDAPEHLVEHYSTIMKPAPLRAAYLLRADRGADEIAQALEGEERIAVIQAIAGADSASGDVLASIAGYPHAGIARKVLEHENCPPRAVAPACCTVALAWASLPSTAHHLVFGNIAAHHDAFNAVAEIAEDESLCKELLDRAVNKTSTFLDGKRVDTGTPELSDKALANLAERAVFPELRKYGAHKHHRSLGYLLAIGIEGDLAEATYRIIEAVPGGDEAYRQSVLDKLDPLGALSGNDDVIRAATLTDPDEMRDLAEAAITSERGGVLQALGENPALPADLAAKLVTSVPRPAGVLNVHGQVPEVAAAALLATPESVASRTDLRDGGNREAILAALFPLLRGIERPERIVVILERHRWFADGCVDQVPAEFLGHRNMLWGDHQLVTETVTRLVRLGREDQARLQIAETLLPDFTGTVGELVELTRMVMSEAS